MIDIDSIYSLYYEPESPLWQLLHTHCELVAGKALECVRKHGLDADTEFIRESAMLHDIGIFRTYAPGILCTGTEPYIRHGVIGRELLDSLGLPKHALVCERHTGAGLTIDDIRNEKLSLPLRDMCPVTLEEKVICYADKFFSKSGDFYREKSLPRVIDSMKKHGPDTLARFMEMHELFG